MKLFLVRHGRTIANVSGALDTAFPGNPLDDEGLRQAATLPDRLGDDLAGIGALRVSPILRARQTIAPIEEATGLTAVIDSGLREVLAGDLEMRTDARSVLCYTDTTRAWMSGRIGARLPGSPENGAETLARFDSAVARVCADAEAAVPGSAALVVAHGTVLRLWTALSAAAASGVAPEWIADHPMTNTAITRLEGDPEGGWRLLSWSDGAWAPEGAGLL